jgi:hypothetical protein
LEQDNIYYNKNNEYIAYDKQWKETDKC